jgi:hypothetical protein
MSYKFTNCTTVLATCTQKTFALGYNYDWYSCRQHNHAQTAHANPVLEGNGLYGFCVGSQPDTGKEVLVPLVSSGLSPYWKGPAPEGSQAMSDFLTKADASCTSTCKKDGTLSDDVMFDYVTSQDFMTVICSCFDGKKYLDGFGTPELRASAGLSNFYQIVDEPAPYNGTVKAVFNGSPARSDRTLDVSGKAVLALSLLVSFFMNI